MALDHILPAADPRRRLEISKPPSPDPCAMDTAHRPHMNWKTGVLPKVTMRALHELSRQSWFRRSNWYLAGGTALALWVGHRSSVDLDFFTPQATFSATKLLTHLPKQHWTTDRLLEGTIFGTYDEARVSFIAYPFFRPRDVRHAYGTIHVLDPDDIAVMKIVRSQTRFRRPLLVLPPPRKTS